MTSGQRLRRPIGERTLAWIYTGPPGHLWSPVADIAALWTRWIVQRLRESRRSHA